MNRYRVVIVGLLALAGVLLIMTLWPSRPVEQTERPALAAERKRPSAHKNTASKAGREKESARVRAAQGDTSAAEPVGAEQPVAARSDKKQTVAAEAKTPREKAVLAWEALVDQVAEQKQGPAAENAQRVKEAFDKLDKEDQLDGIRRSLNLFPDEQFPALYAILYDKAENPEVLDAIFSDALNRPEEIKNPLMKELRKDREHPMFFESARILDVVEPAEEKAQPK
jgi:hypothetical protein